MKLFLIALGSKVLELLKNFISSTVGRVTIAVTLVLVLLTLIPFEISIPQEIVEIFKSGLFKDLLLSLTFLFPVSFGLKCLLALLIAKHSSIFAKLVRIIFGVFTGGGNKE